MNVREDLIYKRITSIKEQRANFRRNFDCNKKFA